jgi:hypothetical protein
MMRHLISRPDTDSCNDTPATTGGQTMSVNHLHDAIRRGAELLASQQQQDGRWDGEYGGPMFLLPLYVAGAFITGQEIPQKRRDGMTAYFLHVQNHDGSIGLHSEAKGSMFCTSLSYVALRYLGLPADDPAIVRMRRWIHDHGTPLGAASWGTGSPQSLRL